jgi:hypothetical protein
VTRVIVGRSRSAYRDGDDELVVEISGDNTLDSEQAQWLRNRIGEELSLLDGGAVTADTPATDEIDVDEHPPDEMTASPEYHTRQGESGDRDGTGEESDGREGSEDACPDFGEEFASERGVKIHRTKAHGDDADEEEEHECPTCGGVFDSTVGMKTHHYRVHDVTVDERSDDDAAAAAEEVEDDGIGQDEDVDESEISDRAQPQASLPFACPVVDCEKRFASREDCRTHRDNVHIEVEVMRGYRERAREKLPDSIPIVDVGRAVAANTTAGEVGDALGVEKRHAREWVNMLQLTDALREHGEVQAIHMVENLHDELGGRRTGAGRPGGRRRWVDVSALAETVFITGLLAGLVIGSGLAVYALVYAIGRRERRDHRYARGDRR